MPKSQTTFKSNYSEAYNELFILPKLMDSLKKFHNSAFAPNEIPLVLKTTAQIINIFSGGL